MVAVKEEDRNRIGAIYILPEYQNKGIGKKLMSLALEWLGDDKITCFEVVTYNIQAISFYKKFGFVENGVGSNPVGNLPSGKMLPEIEMVKKF